MTETKEPLISLGQVSKGAILHRLLCGSG